MALHLVTGYSGKAHITSADQGALNAATFGRGNYVLNVGQQFSARVITNNSINVLDGEVIMQGRHIRLESGAFEEVTIGNGAQGYFRNDLICIRYTKDSTTGIEEAALVVIKGNPDASAAVDPAYNNGSILDGILTVDFPLYRVPLNGLNIGDLVALFKAKGSIDERIEGKVDKVQGKGLSTNDYSNAEKKQVADNKTDIANLKAGTTPVGNANKLGGKGASEYALEADHKIKTFRTLEQIGISDSNISSSNFLTAITTVINAMPNGSDLYLRSDSGSNFSTVTAAKVNADTGMSYSAADMVIVVRKFYTDNATSEINVHFDTTTGRTRIYTCLFDTSSSKVNVSKFAETYNDAGFLPLSGGTLSDNITIDKKSSSLVSTAIEVKNTGGRIQLIASSGGNLGLYDPATSTWIVKKATDGKVFIDGDNTPLHTGNKPTGTYTGNGSATKRTISTGGMGRILFMWSEYSFGFVTPAGGMFWRGSSNGTSYDSSVIRFSNKDYDAEGELVIIGTNEHFNSSSYTYKYQVL